MADLLVVFITGVTTGGLSCMAVQGGLLASSIANQVEDDVKAQLQARPPSRKSKKARRAQAAVAPPPVRAQHIARPIALFLASKLVVYTLLGFLLGWIGSLIHLTPALRGALQIAIGVFMVGNALRMLDVHPIFRYFIFEPPKSVTRYLRRRARAGSDDIITPLFLGALTVLIPCGVTQAMMALAIGSGDPLTGALIMFAFTLGTTPVFFALAYTATRLGSLLEARFVKVVAIVVLVLGLFSITTGLNLLDSPLSPNRLVNALRPVPTPVVGTSPALPFDPGAAVDITRQGAAPPVTVSGQADASNTVTIRADNDGYSPNISRARSGEPVTLNLVTNKTFTCAQAFVIPSLGIERLLPDSGVTPISLPAQPAGSVLRYTCSMGMFTGEVLFE